MRAGVDGYVHQLQLYMSKIANITKYGLRERVVMDLTKKLQTKNFKVYFWRFFFQVRNYLTDFKQTK